MKFSIVLPFRTIHINNGYAVGYSKKSGGKAAHFRTISVGASVTKQDGRVLQFENGKIVGYSVRVSLTRTRHYTPKGKYIGETRNYLLFRIHRGHVWGID